MATLISFSTSGMSSKKTSGKQRTWKQMVEQMGGQISHPLIALLILRLLWQEPRFSDVQCNRLSAPVCGQNGMDKFK